MGKVGLAPAKQLTTLGDYTASMTLTALCPDQVGHDMQYTGAPYVVLMPATAYDKQSACWC